MKRAGRWLAIAGIALLLGWLGLSYFGAVDSPGDRASRERLAKLLREGTKFELFSIYASDGPPAPGEKPFAASGDKFLGWPVIGKVALDDPKIVGELAEPFIAAASCFGSDSNCPRPMCFQPRHAIRVVHAGAVTELLICFECRQVKAKGGIGEFLIGGTPEAAFDAVLRRAGVELSRDIEKRANTPPEFYAAAVEGRADEVARLLKAGADPLTRWRGGSALGEAAWKGHPQVVTLLLDAGAPLEGNGNERTPLQNAAYGGHLEAVRLLVERKANVQAINQGDTALHLATFRGSLPVVAYLLEKGAQPNVPNEYHGRTPLHIAALDGKEDIVKALLAKGGDPTQVSRLKQTPLDEARQGKHAEIVRLLEAATKR